MTTDVGAEAQDDAPKVLGEGEKPLFAECKPEQRMNAPLNRVAPLNSCAFPFFTFFSICESVLNVTFVASRFISPRIEFEDDEEDRRSRKKRNDDQMGTESRIHLL